MPAVPLSEIVAFVSGNYTGPADVAITGVAPLSDAGEGQLSFLANPKYAAQVESTRASAVLVSNELSGDSPRFIRVKDPYFAMASVVAKWFDETPVPKGISPHASIAESAKLGQNVAIGAFVSIGEDAVIGDNVVIHPNVSIGAGAAIGEDSIIYSQVSIYHRCIVGKRCIVHSGVVIGSDGYGFATHGGRHHKIPQIGIVRIEDDVEIGAGSTIDRAALGETVIGEGTKIDNLVQVGHNVKVGKHCFLVAQVGIAGSAQIGDYVAIAGQSGVAGHLKVGSRAQIAAKSAVLEDVGDGEKVMGIPAVPFREFARREATLRRMLRKR
jgi:UDP-3-O-[3-hydroxymyristoyl] glucosamine N-acyltransferase